MLPINDFIFSNPDWASIPIQAVLGVTFLLMFLLAIGYGVDGAREIVTRFRWFFAVALAIAAVWGIYAYAVLYPPSLWWQ